MEGTGWSREAVTCKPMEEIALTGKATRGSRKSRGIFRAWTGLKEEKAPGFENQPGAEAERLGGPHGPVRRMAVVFDDLSQEPICLA